MTVPTSVVLENVFGTLATILWTIQLAPQVVHNWRRKSSEGTSIWMMLLWYVGGLFQATLFVYLRLSLPLMIQPHGFSLLSMICCMQFFYYGPTLREWLRFTPGEKGKLHTISLPSEQQHIKLVPSLSTEGMVLRETPLDWSKHGSVLERVPEGTETGLQTGKSAADVKESDDGGERSLNNQMNAAGLQQEEVTQSISGQHHRSHAVQVTLPADANKLNQHVTCVTTCDAPSSTSNATQEMQIPIEDNVILQSQPPDGNEVQNLQVPVTGTSAQQSLDNQEGQEMQIAVEASAARQRASHDSHEGEKMQVPFKDHELQQSPIGQDRQEMQTPLENIALQESPSPHAKNGRAHITEQLHPAPVTENPHANVTVLDTMPIFRTNPDASVLKPHPPTLQLPPPASNAPIVLTPATAAAFAPLDFTVRSTFSVDASLHSDTVMSAGPNGHDASIQSPTPLKPLGVPRLHCSSSGVKPFASPVDSPVSAPHEVLSAMQAFQASFTHSISNLSIVAASIAASSLSGTSHRVRSSFTNGNRHNSISLRSVIQDSPHEIHASLSPAPNKSTTSQRMKNKWKDMLVLLVFFSAVWAITEYFVVQALHNGDAPLEIAVGVIPPVCGFVGFLPQIIESLMLKSTHGISMAFLLLDFFGGSFGALSLAFKAGPYNVLAAFSYLAIVIGDVTLLLLHVWFSIVRNYRMRAAEHLSVSQHGPLPV